jgi:hypothetical protein
MLRRDAVVDVADPSHLAIALSATIPEPEPEPKPEPDHGGCNALGGTPGALWMVAILAALIGSRSSVRRRAA